GVGFATRAAGVVVETPWSGGMMRTAMKKTAIVALTAGAVSLAAVAFAQQAAFKRTVLQQADISAPGREAVTAFVEFQPGGSPGRHTHPGEEIGYVIEGTGLLEREGKPKAKLRAGQAFLIPPGTVDTATNTGQGT